MKQSTHLNFKTESYVFYLNFTFLVCDSDFTGQAFYPLFFCCLKEKTFLGKRSHTVV